MLIHDVFLNDELDGPLPIALYSAALFRLTEGRAYSAGEYAGWMRAAGLQVHPPVATMVHCSMLPGRKVGWRHTHRGERTVRIRDAGDRNGGVGRQTLGRSASVGTHPSASR